MAERYVLAMVIVPERDAGKVAFVDSAVHISNEFTLDELLPENFDHMLPTLMDEWLVQHRALDASNRNRPVRSH